MGLPWFLLLETSVWGALDIWISPYPWSSLSPVVIVGDPNPPLHLLELNLSCCLPPAQLFWAVPMMGHLFEWQSPYGLSCFEASLSGLGILGCIQAQGYGAIADPVCSLSIPSSHSPPTWLWLPNFCCCHQHRAPQLPPCWLTMVGVGSLSTWVLEAFKLLMAWWVKTGALAEPGEELDSHIGFGDEIENYPSSHNMSLLTFVVEEMHSVANIRTKEILICFRKMKPYLNPPIDVFGSWMPSAFPPLFTNGTDGLYLFLFKKQANKQTKPSVLQPRIWTNIFITYPRKGGFFSPDLSFSCLQDNERCRTLI